MTLKRLVLHNYMIHRDLTADFDGNLIALTGEMGHGKSTFVGAIQFCLTGEHPPWHRDDLLSWGASEGSAKLYFSQDGIECSILRKLHSPEVILKMGDVAVTGARNVEKAMTEQLGVDKDILKQIGFVQQYEIQSILFDDPGKRERSFQKLLGIGDANKIWTELGPIIQSYSRSENFDATIESLKQMVKRLNEELEAVDKTLETSKTAMSLLPSNEELNKEIERLTKVQSKISMLVEIRKSLARTEAVSGTAAIKLASLTTNRKNILESMGGSPDEMRTYVDSLRSNYTAALGSLNNMKMLSGASDTNGGSCPLCGNHVDPGFIAEHTASELAKLNKLKDDAKAEFDSAAQAFDRITGELARLDQSINELNRTIVQNDAMATANKEREKQLLQEYAELGISPEEATSGTFLDEITKRLNDYRRTVAEASDINMRISALQGEKNAKKQQLDRAVEMMEAKVKEKELSVPMAKKIEILANVRNWFHSSNGPRSMSMSAIKAMTGYVNEYLKELHSEIEVMPDNQGLSFAFDYIDGRQVSDPPPSTAKLSGGQKIELALAFRLAIYRYFGQKMGIMVLDEPTAHLSPAGIEYFGTLLQTVSTLAKNMNLQIIMPTHEKEIMPYMDSEIHFD